jgi:hypothetical protein
MNAPDGVADEFFDRRDDRGERVTVVGLPGSALAWIANWPPLSVQAVDLGGHAGRASDRAPGRQR